jgi:hypothetical protein
MVNLTNTRRGLHAVSELLIAGPQYEATGDIRLVAVPGGFGGRTDTAVRVTGTELVTPNGSFPLRGTLSEIARAASITPRPLRDVYSDGPDLSPDEPLEVSAAAARVLLPAFGAGDAALRALAPNEEPILWPEHFDIAITFGEVNYGVSPGDSLIGEPYAYVGPWKVPVGPFWNQPFGAARVLSELPTADDILRFFVAGREAANS